MLTLRRGLRAGSASWVGQSRAAEADIFATHAGGLTLAAIVGQTLFGLRDAGPALGDKFAALRGFGIDPLALRPERFAKKRAGTADLQCLAHCKPTPA
jgi:hypothetical protein